MDDPFWKEDPTVLFRKNKLKEFVPSGSMSFNQKLNAITRFLIYFITILYTIYGVTETLLLLGIGLAVIYIMYDYKIDIMVSLNKRSELQEEESEQELIDAKVNLMEKQILKPEPNSARLRGNSLEELARQKSQGDLNSGNEDQSLLPNGLFDDGTDLSAYKVGGLDFKYSKKGEGEQEQNRGSTNVRPESGQGGSEFPTERQVVSGEQTTGNPNHENNTNDLTGGGLLGYSDPGFASVNAVKNEFTPPSQSGQKGGDCSKCAPANSPYNPPSCKRGGTTALDANMNMCQMPTKDNPFMNVLVTDYANNPNRLPACNPEIVRNDTDNMFSNNLYRNINDVWNRNNGQLTYHTQNSTTIPNDRDAFQKWLYTVPYVCKDGDMEACYRGAEVQMGQMRHGKIF